MTKSDQLGAVLGPDPAGDVHPLHPSKGPDRSDAPKATIEWPDDWADLHKVYRQIGQANDQNGQVSHFAPAYAPALGSHRNRLRTKVHLPKIV